MTTSAVSNAVLSQCDCDVAIGSSYNTKLKCFAGDQSKIVFVTTVYGLNESVQQIEQVVKRWPTDAASSVSVSTSDNVLAVTAVCLEETMSNTTCFVGTGGESDDKGKSNKGVLAGVIVTVIVIFILIIVVIVVFIIIYLKRKRSYK